MPHQELPSPQASFTQQGVPTHVDLVLPVLRAIHQLGGSARSTEITDHILSTYPDSETLLEHHYPGRPEKKVFTDRIAWARSTAKFIGATESPSRGVALLTDLGERLVALGDARAHEQIQELFKKHQRQQRLDKQANSPEQASTPTQTDNVSSAPSDSPDQAIINDAADDDTAQDADWKKGLMHEVRH